MYRARHNFSYVLLGAFYFFGIELVIYFSVLVRRLVVIHHFFQWARENSHHALLGGWRKGIKGITFNFERRRHPSTFTVLSFSDPGNVIFNGRHIKTSPNVLNRFLGRH